MLVRVGFPTWKRALTSQDREAASQGQASPDARSLLSPQLFTAFLPVFFFSLVFLSSPNVNDWSNKAPTLSPGRLFHDLTDFCLGFFSWQLKFEAVWFYPVISRYGKKGEKKKNVEKNTWEGRRTLKGLGRMGLKSDRTHYSPHAVSSLV